MAKTTIAIVPGCMNLFLLTVSSLEQFVRINTVIISGVWMWRLHWALTGLIWTSCHQLDNRQIGTSMPSEDGGGNLSTALPYILEYGKLFRFQRCSFHHFHDFKCY
ncbi:hypothetical protein NC653_008916 [Populus alba x Populus x berolinensis]|uniref:Uncharacterized protein n=1 Tax=Populus alba x Populus x berolinensis TaxID=444605 RepID=A0AAD6R8R8_9ROSI|nr:hypothetical protein NC653_008916 [Populus alba x Populus x berolinensis]